MEEQTATPPPPPAVVENNPQQQQQLKLDRDGEKNPTDPNNQLVAPSSSESSPLLSSSTSFSLVSPPYTETATNKDDRPGEKCEITPKVTGSAKTPEEIQEMERRMRVSMAYAQAKARGEDPLKNMTEGFSPMPVFFGGSLLNVWRKAAETGYQQQQSENQDNNKGKEEETEEDVALRTRRPVMTIEGSGLVVEDLSKPSTRAYIEPEIAPKTDGEWMQVWCQAFDDLQPLCTDPALAQDMFGRRVQVEKAFFSKEETEEVFRPWFQEADENVRSNAAFRFANAKYAIAQRIVASDEVEAIDKKNTEAQEAHEYFSLHHASKRAVNEANTIAMCEGQIKRLQGLMTKFESDKQHEKQADMFTLLQLCKEKLEALKKKQQEEGKKEEKKEQEEQEVQDMEKPPEALVGNETRVFTSDGRPVVEQFDWSLKNKGPSSKNRKHRKKRQAAPTTAIPPVQSSDSESNKRYSHSIWKAAFPIKDGRNLPLQECIGHVLGNKMKIDPQFVPAVEQRDVSPPVKDAQEVPPVKDAQQASHSKDAQEVPPVKERVYRTFHQFDRIPEDKIDAMLLTVNTEDNSGRITTWRNTGLKVVVPATYGGTEKELLVVNHEQVRLFDVPGFTENKNETYYIVPEATVKAKKKARDPSTTLFKAIHCALSDAYILLLGYFADTDVPTLLSIDRRDKIMNVYLSDVPMSSIALSSTQPDTVLIGLCDGVVVRQDLTRVQIQIDGEAEAEAEEGNQGQINKKKKKKKKGGILHQEVCLYPLSEKVVPDNYKADAEYYAAFCTSKQVRVVPPYTDPTRRCTRNTFFAGVVAPIKRIVERHRRVITCSHEGLQLYRLMDHCTDENVVTMSLTRVATFAFVGNILVALMHDNSVSFIELQRCVLEHVTGPPVCFKPAVPPTIHNVEALVVHETSIVVFHGDTTRRVISLRNPANIGLHEYGKPRTAKEREQSFLLPPNNKNINKKKNNKNNNTRTINNNKKKITTNKNKKK